LIASLVEFSTFARADDIAVAPLSDGRLELFVVSDGKLMTSWAKNYDGDPAWVPLIPFNPAPTGPITSVSAGRLLDGRLQVFVTGPNGILVSRKQGVDPNAGWTLWKAFQ
jgi:hypothetical protein